MVQNFFWKRKRKLIMTHRSKVYQPSKNLAMGMLVLKILFSRKISMLNYITYFLKLCIAIFVMEHHWKKPSGHVGTRTCVADLSQQTCYALESRPSCIPKKGCIKPRVKQHCHSPILTSWLTLFLLCNQYYCNI